MGLINNLFITISKKRRKKEPKFLRNYSYWRLDCNHANPTSYTAQQNKNWFQQNKNNKRS